MKEIKSGQNHKNTPIKKKLKEQKPLLDLDDMMEVDEPAKGRTKETSFKKKTKKEIRQKGKGLQKTTMSRKKAGTVQADEDDSPEGVAEHKAQLAALAEKDPEFFKFLQQEDADLLEFDESDLGSADESVEGASSDGSEFDESEAEQDVEDTTKVRKVKVRYDKNGRRIVDQALVDSLEEAFVSEGRPSPSKIRIAVNAFVACVSRVGANIDPPDFVVNDEQVFENVLRLCFQYLGKALYAVLEPVESRRIKKEPKGEPDDEPIKRKTVKASRQVEVQVGNAATRFRKWKKYQPLVKKYLHSALLFLNELQSPEVVVVTLRALTDLVDLFVHFAKLSKNFIKAVVRIWSRRTDECRCAAFVALCKLIRLNKKLYTTVLKACYIAYVSNVRLVTPETWPLITFMQKSFAELCVMHADIAYHYAFVYIRQTAIHVRNAMIAKRKDLIQTIYNWQFVMCLYLWARVISRAYRVRFHDDDARGIVELAYPLCQITITTMRLFPSSKYLPLRLHCVRVLLLIQVNCKIFIPTLSLAVELLEEAALISKKKPSRGKGTVKGIDMNCLLKASASQLEEAGFRQAAFEALFKLQLESAYVIRASCAFADVILPLDQQIKSFVKQCKNSEHARLFKSLSSKLNEHARYAADRITASDVDLNNEHCLAVLDAFLSAEDSPLSKFYKSWQNVWKAQAEIMKQAIASSNTKLKANEKVTRKEKQEDKKVKKNTKANQKIEAPETETDEDEEDEEPAKKKRRNVTTEFRANKDSKLQTVKGDDELRDLVLSDSDEELQ